MAGALASYMNPSNTKVGVGDSDAAWDPGQTDLQGTNTYSKSIDSAVTVQNNVLSMTCTFTGNEANFEWKEFGVFVDDALISRRPQLNGVKQSGQTWVIQVTLTLLAEEPTP